MASIVVNGDTSGSVTLSAPATAGTVTVTLPSASGTMAVSGGSPSFTTITTTSDATISGLTVGKGGGAVASNTAVGASALQANTTGANNTAVGYQAGYSFASTGTAAVTAFGYQAAYSINAADPRNTAIGYQALYTNNGGGSYENTAVGWGAAKLTTTGSGLVAMGNESLSANTTGSSNTAVGYQALTTNTTGIENTAIGYRALTANTTASYNTAVGRYALYLTTTGTHNTCIGHNSGYNISTGTKNTILGRYDGNQGGLDIRTSSNYIVLSDGDGNPKLFNDGTNWTNTGNSFSTTPTTQTNAASFIGNNTGGSFFFSIDNSSGTTFGSGAYARNIYSTGTTYRIYVTAGNAGVYLAPSGTSWTSASDERLKENLVPIDNGLAKVASLRAVTGNYIADETKKSRSFLIAQDLQAVLPEAVDATEPEKLGVSYTDVIPLLVASIKELKTIVDAQAAEIDTVKAELAALKG